MGTLRIIAGTLRGRRIRVPSTGSVRPTGDRAREALFDILGPAVNGARVLDAYAGTGALGFESLSRGAAGVTFVEADRAVLRCLEGNARSLDLADRSRFAAGPAAPLLAAGGIPGGPFDLVLADPPYASGERQRFLAALVAAGVLAPGGTVVLERDRGSEPVETPELRLVRTARYGRTCLDFYRG